MLPIHLKKFEGQSLWLSLELWLGTDKNKSGEQRDDDRDDDGIHVAGIRRAKGAESLAVAVEQGRENLNIQD